MEMVHIWTIMLVLLVASQPFVVSSKELKYNNVNTPVHYPTANAPTSRLDPTSSGGGDMQNVAEIKQIIATFPGIDPDVQKRILYSLQFVEINLNKPPERDSAVPVKEVLDAVKSSLKEQLEQAKKGAGVASKAAEALGKAAQSKAVLKLFSKVTEKAGGILKVAGPVGQILGPILDIASALIEVFIPEPDPIGRVLDGIIERHTIKAYQRQVTGAIAEMRAKRDALQIAANVSTLEHWMDRGIVNQADALFSAAGFIAELRTYLKEGAGDWDAALEKLKMAELTAALETMREFLLLQFYSIAMKQGAPAAPLIARKFFLDERKVDIDDYTKLFLWGSADNANATLLAAAYNPETHPQIAARLTAMGVEDKQIEMYRHCLFNSDLNDFYQIYSKGNDLYRWHYSANGLELDLKGGRGTEFKPFLSKNYGGQNLAIYGSIRWMVVGYTANYYMRFKEQNDYELKTVHEMYDWKFLPIRYKPGVFMLIDQKKQKALYDYQGMRQIYVYLGDIQDKKVQGKLFYTFVHNNGRVVC